MCTSVLTPFDGSHGAEAAQRKTVELSRLCNAEQTFQTVCRHPSMLGVSLRVIRSDVSGNIDKIMRAPANLVASEKNLFLQWRSHNAT